MMNIFEEVSNLNAEFEELNKRKEVLTGKLLGLKLKTGFVSLGNTEEGTNSFIPDINFVFFEKIKKPLGEIDSQSFYSIMGLALSDPDTNEKISSDAEKKLKELAEDIKTVIKFKTTGEIKIEDEVVNDDGVQKEPVEEVANDDTIQEEPVEEAESDVTTQCEPAKGPANDDTVQEEHEYYEEEDVFDRMRG